MELLQLSYFREVANQESISKAARTLHISQPALSISIARLEEELGVHLFDRVSGRIRLNAMGASYLKYVERMFLNLREAKVELDSQDVTGTIEIRVAGSTMGMCAPLMEEYIGRHPRQRLSFFVYSDENIKSMLERGEIDFAICARQVYGHDILWTPLFDERVVVMVPLEHPFAARRYVELSDLKDQNFVVQRSAGELTGEYASLFDNTGYAPLTSVSTNELEVAIKAVDAGAGIMVASFLSSQRLSANKGHMRVHTNIPLKTEGFHRSLGIARLHGHYFTRPVQECFDFVVDFFMKQYEIQETFFKGVYDD